MAQPSEASSPGKSSDVPMSVADTGSSSTELESPLCDDEAIDFSLMESCPPCSEDFPETWNPLLFDIRQDEPTKRSVKDMGLDSNQKHSERKPREEGQQSETLGLPAMSKRKSSAMGKNVKGLTSFSMPRL